MIFDLRQINVVAAIMVAIVVGYFLYRSFRFWQSWICRLWHTGKEVGWIAVMACGLLVVCFALVLLLMLLLPDRLWRKAFSPPPEPL